jgi:hypothetical protein
MYLSFPGSGNGVEAQNLVYFHGSMMLERVKTLYTAEATSVCS